MHYLNCLSPCFLIPDDYLSLNYCFSKFILLICHECASCTDVVKSICWCVLCNVQLFQYKRLRLDAVRLCYNLTMEVTIFMVIACTYQLDSAHLMYSLLQCMVYSCMYFPSSDRDQPDLGVKMRLRQLEEKFNDLLVMAQKALVSQNVPVSEIHLRLTALCIDIEDNIPLFNTHMLGVIAKSNVPEIFALMTRIKAWDILNYRVLTTLLKKCIPEDEVHGYVEQYSAKADTFKRQTLVRDYVMLRGSSLTYPRGYATFSAKIEEKYNQYTLADLAKDEAFLANEFLLQQMIFRFKESQQGCISVTWFIPKSSMSHLTPPLINKSWEALKKRGIIELIVDEKYIYRVCCKEHMHCSNLPIIVVYHSFLVL